MNDMASPLGDIREEVRKLCGGFAGEYWRTLDRALTDAGYLAALIPEEYGGVGLPVSAAAAMLEEIQRWRPSRPT
jgi:acyl-CoA dehydrogenase